MRKILAILFGLFSLSSISTSEELPVPTYNNAVIISIEHFVGDSAEVDYIKNNFNFGLYAWLGFSKTHIDPDLDWHESWDNADLGIEAFKNSINQYIQYATDKNVKIHIVLCSGLARGLQIYREAKEEDIRNCQWYNDNKLASNTQIVDPNAMNTYIWGTFSRYARKMQSNLEAKAKAALAFLKEKMDENPNVLIALSGWGEAELNFRRLDPTKSIQDYFCGYSPFAILEFQDWIRHTGMYDDSAGKYAGQGYSGGGARYQGSQGLANFNQDFGTSFTTWDLKYYNWSLSDDYDSDPTDYVNNDPNKIPSSSYSHGNMMPTSGPDYIAGGFDPPRTIILDDEFWQLWNLFRETMVYNFVKDMAKWAQEAGIPSEKWFSHQIPADYLFGTSPDTGNLGGRYYTSASPLWTADVQPYGSVGATIYDIKFPKALYPPEFARTTEYGVPAISDMASNWAIMEYDAETYPPGYDVSQSTPEFILDQFLGIYDYNVHLINFWRWWDTSGEHRIKGMNKETALGYFIERIRDKARRKNLSYVFDPPKVVGVSGLYNAVSGAVEIDVGGEIWNGENWEWKDWGDFDHFEIHRSTVTGFTPDAGTLIGTTSDYLYEDLNYVPGFIYHYKVRAVNSEGGGGPYSDETTVSLIGMPYAVLSVSKNSLYFGAERGVTCTSTEKVLVVNTGDAGTTVNWTTTPSAGWIQVTPTSNSGEGVLSVSMNISGLNTGTYNGEVVVEDSCAYDSPQIIQVQLKVYPTDGDSAPFGYIDTPVDGSNVYGSVPVTGWALDDVEVTKVEIKRAPHVNDSPVVIGPDGLVYIGDAVFVRGARTDVESSYPTYPRADRAGWGYMLLTYFLPNQGNGTFTLYAVAYDGSGHQVELGQKVIYGDNANSVKPFGTIDTPVQGGVVSGADYVNFGWALTPQPKYIPYDGSTIWVWVDGVPVGHPVYDNYRADIAALFPGYANSNGAVGYYYLDTTAYTNGVHVIQWSVEDNEGEACGIGSRYFEVQNVVGILGDTMSFDVNSHQVDTSGWLRLRVLGMERGYRGRKVEGQEERQIRLMSADRYEMLEAVREREDGVYEVEIEELERIELHFRGEGGKSFIGWGENSSKPLPVGSTLDERECIFYWHPGPGFLGKHVLHFALTDGFFYSQPIKIVVNISPKKFPLIK